MKHITVPVRNLGDLLIRLDTSGMLDADMGQEITDISLHAAYGGLTVQLANGRGMDFVFQPRSLEYCTLISFRNVPRKVLVPRGKQPPEIVQRFRDGGYTSKELTADSFAYLRRHSLGAPFRGFGLPDGGIVSVIYGMPFGDGPRYEEGEPLFYESGHGFVFGFGRDSFRAARQRVSGRLTINYKCQNISRT